MLCPNGHKHKIRPPDGSLYFLELVDGPSASHPYPACRLNSMSLVTDFAL